MLESFFLEQADLFHFVSPRGGLTAFPGLIAGPAEAFCQAALTEAGLLLLPGRLYGEEWADRFRIGFGRLDFAANLQRLDAFCQLWKSRHGGGEKRHDSVN